MKGGPLNVFRPVGSTERNILLKIRKGNMTLDEAKAVIQRSVSICVIMSGCMQRVFVWMLEYICVWT